MSTSANVAAPHFSAPTWAKWIKAGIAGAIPGAAAFTQTVHALGGLVAIVTNRDTGNDAVTRTNLKTLGIWFDYEIGRKEGEPSEKSQRWRDAVTILAQRVGGSPRPVMWLGDQVTDFPILDAQGHIVRAMSQHDAGRSSARAISSFPTRSTATGARTRRTDRAGPPRAWG